MSLFFFFFSKKLTSLEKFHLRISKKEIYPKDDPLVDAIIHDMISLPIQDVGKSLHATIIKK